MLTNLLLPQGYLGPGTATYPVSSNPGGAVLFVLSTSGVDNRGRVTFPETTASVAAQSVSAQGPYGQPGKPLATVFGTNGALSYCKANRGDLIVVLPGHTETLPNATGAVTIPAGVSILGIGYGGARPTFSWGNAGGYITAGGAGCQLQNCIFDGSAVAAVTKMFLFSTGGAQLVSCRLITASATNQATDCIVLNAGADDFLFANGEIDSSAAAGTARQISNPAANAINRFYIYNSFLHGNLSAANISILTTTTKEFLIEGNTLRNDNAAFVTLALAAGNTITGIVSNNDVMMAGAGQTTFVSGGGGTGMAFLQNFAWDTKASTNSGILIPAAGTL